MQNAVLLRTKLKISGYKRSKIKQFFNFLTSTWQLFHSKFIALEILT